MGGNSYHLIRLQLQPTYIIDIIDIIDITQKMFAYLSLAVVALILWKLHKSVLKPYLLYQSYKKTLNNSKYNVYFWNFFPFSSSLLIESHKYSKDFKDVFYGAKHAEELMSPQPIYDLSVCNFANKIMVSLRHPQLIKELYALDGGELTFKWPQLLKNMKRIVGESITFTEGEKWKRKRKSMTTLLNFQYVLSKFPAIHEIIDDSIHEASQGRDEFEVDLRHIIENITSSVIVELFFGGGEAKGKSLEVKGERLGKFSRSLFEEIGAQIIDPLAFIFGQQFASWNLREKDRQVSAKLKLYHECLRNFIEGRIYEIKEGRKKDSKEDYIEKVYLAAKEEERDSEEFKSGLIQDFSSIFLAGTDTTSHSALMMVYFCLMFPEVGAKVRAQISEHVKAESDLTFETIKQMKYLDCLFYETTRFYQSANGIFFREASRDIVLDDIVFQKGTIFAIESVMNHYYSANYEKPLEFRPERWLGEGGKQWAPEPYTYLTFSAGPRSCIGKQLAQLEMKLIVIKLMRDYEMEMETMDLELKMENLSYQPQKMKTRFRKRLID